MSFFLHFYSYLNFPSSSGITLPTAFAAPVEEGIIFTDAARSQSFLDGPSVVICVEVVA
jgi:hypothetical protein